MLIAGREEDVDAGDEPDRDGLLQVVDALALGEGDVADGDGHDDHRHEAGLVGERFGHGEGGDGGADHEQGHLAAAEPLHHAREPPDEEGAPPAPTPSPDEEAFEFTHQVGPAGSSVPARTISSRNSVRSAPRGSMMTPSLARMSRRAVVDAEGAQQGA